MTINWFKWARRFMGRRLRRSPELWRGYCDNVAIILWDELGVDDKATRDRVADLALRRVFFS